MLTLRVRAETTEVKQLVNRLRRESPIALAKALTFTVERVRDGLKEEMVRAFSLPVPFTLNSLRLKTANPASLTAEVRVREEAGKGTAAIKYLAPQIYGGKRNHKRFESYLQREEYLFANEVAVPANRIKKPDGNVSAGTYIRVMSQLRLQRGTGFESRIGGKEFSKEKVAKSVAKQGGRIFVSRGDRGLPRGVYFRESRKGKGAKSSVLGMFFFIRSPHYRKRFKYFEVGQRLAAKHLPEQVRRQLEKFTGPS